MSIAVEPWISRAEASGSRSPALPTAFLAIAAWTAVVYLPFWRLDGPDDCFYVEAAHLWTRGLPPYVGAFDVKAPGFFAVLAAAQALFGAGLATLRGVAILFTAIAATAVHGMSRRFHGRATAALCAALFPILFAIYSDAAYSVLCGFVSLAFLVALSKLPPLRRAALAGLAIGAACSVKQTAALEALVLLALLASDPEAKGMARKTIAAFVAAASLIPLGFVGYYALRGDLDVFLADVVVTALKRPQSATDAISFAAGMRRTFTMQLPILPLSLCAMFGLAGRRRLPPGFPMAWIGLWLAAAFAAIVIQHAISAYYFAPALAPMLLLAASGLASATQPGGRGAVFAALAIFAGVTACMAVTLRGEAIVRSLQPVEEKAIRVAAAAVEARNPAPADRLFVVSRGGWLNVATDLAPPTPYFHWFHTLCDFPGAGPGRLAEALAAKPRFLVVADPTKRFQCELDASRALVAAALASSYRLLMRADGDHDFYGVYERD